MDTSSKTEQQVPAAKGNEQPAAVNRRPERIVLMLIEPQQAPALWRTRQD